MIDSWTKSTSSWLVELGISSLPPLRSPDLLLSVWSPVPANYGKMEAFHGAGEEGRYI